MRFYRFFYFWQKQSPRNSEARSENFSRPNLVIFTWVNLWNRNPFLFVTWQASCGNRRASNDRWHLKWNEIQHRQTWQQRKRRTLENRRMNGTKMKIINVSAPIKLQCSSNSNQISNFRPNRVGEGSHHVVRLCSFEQLCTISVSWWSTIGGVLPEKTVVNINSPEQ